MRTKLGIERKIGAATLPVSIAALLVGLATLLVGIAMLSSAQGVASGGEPAGDGTIATPHGQPAGLQSGQPTVADVPYGTGEWDADTLGNHRAVVRVGAPSAGDSVPATPGGAVRVRIPWRRRDLEPERKSIVMIDAATGSAVDNLVRVEINREFGDLAFEPTSGEGEYFVYYMPYISSGGNYPRVHYPEPEPTADSEWLRANRLAVPRVSGTNWQRLPEASVVELQAIDELNSFDPMEVIATEREVEELLAANPAPYLLFPEDRTRPIKMTGDLPRKWVRSGPGGSLVGEAARGEFYVFQIGVFAANTPIDDLEVDFGPLRQASGGGAIPTDAFTCINLGGVDSAGREFTKTVSVTRGKVQPLWCGVQIPEGAPAGAYDGTVTVRPEGMEPSSIDLDIAVTADLINAAGDDEPWRLARLRWLDSRIGFDDEIVAPYEPVNMEGNLIRVLGREVTLSDAGFPALIKSFFAPEMTHLTEDGRAVLHGPVELVVENADGASLEWRSSGPRRVREAPGIAVWEAESTAGPVSMEVHGEAEFDGNLEFTVVIRADRPTQVNDIRLRIPMADDVARYMMGMGLRGGYRPDELHWEWDVATKNQDGAWIGDVNAGLQFSLRDENYVRPLNTNFYLTKPLVEPASWVNDGSGGCDLVEADVNPTGVNAAVVSAPVPAFLVTCTSGARTLQPDEPLHFDFRLAITPFRPIDTDKQWRTRFYHRFSPVEEVEALGANTINVHHATDINPYINYPFLRPDEMKAYVDEAHAADMKMKIYYTVRELTNRAPEIFALRSLGDEIFSSGSGGGFAWLQEHLDQDYIAAWFVPRLKDAAIVNSGVSRWHNFYLEGLNWLVNNIEIDGLYIDDVAFDRTTMKRLRKILDRARPGGLIDLHSANQYNPRDGFTNSANLYLEHFPYIDRLWFGEYFDYDMGPDFWLIETSGIPFGLMGEMLQGGGNPWRGMIFGMTNRQPYGGHDPSPIWDAWDQFGIEDSRMVGYWVPDPPVRTDHPDVPATSYVADGKTMVSVASWADGAVDIALAIDWEAIGLDPATARIRAPAIRDFQEATSFGVNDRIPVAPGRGWLLIIEGQ